MEATFKEIKFTDSDIINIADFIPKGEYNPHNVRPYLIHEFGFTIGVVFASSLQDALDILVDNNKLDAWQVKDDDADYNEKDRECLTFLGNASEAFDIGTIDVLELPIPERSFVAEFVASQKN